MNDLKRESDDSEETTEMKTVLVIRIGGTSATGKYRTQLAQYIRCLLYSEKLSWPIFTKTADKLVLGPTKIFY